MVLALEAGLEERPATWAARHRARHAISERRARPDAAGEHLLRSSAGPGRGHRFREGNENRRQVLAAVQPAGLCLPVPRPVRAGGDRVQEVTSSSSPNVSETVRLVCRAADEDGALRRVDRDLQEGARPSTANFVALSTSASATTSCSRGSRPRRAETFAKIAAVARNTGEKRTAHFWTAAGLRARGRHRQGRRRD